MMMFHYTEISFSIQRISIVHLKTLSFTNSVTYTFKSSQLRKIPNIHCTRLLWHYWRKLSTCWGRFICSLLASHGYANLPVRLICSLFRRDCSVAALNSANQHQFARRFCKAKRSSSTIILLYSWAQWLWNQTVMNFKNLKVCIWSEHGQLLKTSHYFLNIG